MTEQLEKEIRNQPCSREVDLHGRSNNMIALINPAVLPALRTAATFFLIINLIGGTYIFRNRHRFFDQGSNVDNDIPAVRKLRMEVVMVPSLVSTTLLVVLLIYLWSA